MGASGGSLIGQVKMGLAGVALVALAACEAPQREVAFSNELVMFAAARMESEARKDVGRDIGGGMVVRNVKRTGSAVRVDFTYTDRQGIEVFKAEPEIVKELLTRTMISKVCDTPEKRGMVNSGLTMDIRIFAPKGAQLTAFKVDKC